MFRILYVLYLHNCSLSTFMFVLSWCCLFMSFLQQVFALNDENCFEDQTYMRYSKYLGAGKVQSV
jgi:hypothetical protein